jgi:heme A synthase
MVYIAYTIVGKISRAREKVVGERLTRVGFGRGSGGNTAFRIVILATIVAAVGQIALGGVVRVSNSGLGCPDWPLCHGRIIPPFELHTLIEYSHRLSASTLGFLVLAATIMVWRAPWRSTAAVVAMTGALVLVGVAAVLGGITVLTELEWWVVLFHLGIAEGVVAGLVIAAMAGWRGGPAAEPAIEGSVSVRMRWMTGLALMGTFLLILSGSYMIGRGYGSSCSAWPGCLGTLLPSGEAYLTHMSHRYVAGLAGFLVLVLTAVAWYESARPRVRWTTLAVLVLFVVQGLAGAITVWSGFAAGMKAAHLAMATIVWVALVYVAVLQVPGWPVALRRVDKSPDPAVGLEGASF